MISCAICGRSFRQITGRHCQTHGIDLRGYRELYPEASLGTRKEFLKGNTPWNKGILGWGTNPSRAGQKNSAEEKVKKSKSLKKYYKSHPGPNTGKKRSAGAIKATAEKNLGQKRTLEQRRRISESHKGLTYPNKKAFIANPTKLELMFGKMLEELSPGKWRYVGNGQLRIEGKAPDFVYEDLLIEILGCYWHSCPKCFPEGGRCGKDDFPRRYTVFARHGFPVLGIWEHDIHNNPSGVKQQVRQFEALLESY